VDIYATIVGNVCGLAAAPAPAPAQCAWQNDRARTICRLARVLGSTIRRSIKRS
jgi:hypothetical protein